MLDITTIILTYNEEKHIKRCLENVLKFSKKVYVIDSLSTDRTHELCMGYGDVELVEHSYPGNQAEQFNWALDNLKIDTEWTFRIDADEYLSENLIDEMNDKVPGLPSEITGIELKRDVIFMGKRIRYGKLGTIKLLRLWRTGKGRYENRIMDEHAVLTDGHSILFDNYFFDNNLNGVDAWTIKHIDYANRELTVLENNMGKSDGQLEHRNRQKDRYYSLPMYHRGFWFFILRYIFLGGFLDGKAGFVWHFMQCWWYRTLIDIKIDEQSQSRL